MKNKKTYIKALEDIKNYIDYLLITEKYDADFITEKLEAYIDGKIDTLRSI